jgi:hypothetical protein
MLALGERNVSLCLLDTLAVSEMVKRPSRALGHFLTWALDAEPSFLPCFSPFTLLELRQSPPLFERFIELFHPLPCVLLKGYDQLLEEEIAAYADPSVIDPRAIAFTPRGDVGNLLTNLPTILQAPQLVERERHWNAERQGIVDGMVSLSAL